MAKPEVAELRKYRKVQIPKGREPLDQDLEHGFRFQQFARPSPHITASSQEKISDSDVYGAMASSAFDDFRDRLIKSYGLSSTAAP